MKKFRTLSSVLLVFLMLVTIFAMPVSALTPTQESVNLVVTKYQITQMNGETDKIGYDETLVGTESEAPTGYKTLSGVEFTIYKLGELGTYVTENDITAIENSYDETNKTIDFGTKTGIKGTSLTTADDGTATFTVNKADFGVYFVKETAAPKSVSATAKSFVVELPRTNAAGNGFMDTVYVYPKNYTTLGAVILQKVDSSKNTPLEGAEFALYNDADDTQVTTDYVGTDISVLRTDAYGYIYVNNLLPGTYYFKETKAPQGYIQRGDSDTFTITSGKSSSVVYDNAGEFERTGTPAELTFDNSSQPQVKKYVTTIGNKEQNVAFAENAKWIVVADVPSDMGANYTEYKLTDKMDAELKFVADSVKVYTTKDSNAAEANWDVFTAFTATAPDANNEFTVNFTTAELAGVKMVKVEYNTTLNENTTVMGDDVFNNVTLDYTVSLGVAPDGTPNEVKGSDTEENPPYVYTGGYKFKKTSIDGTTALKDAEFAVCTSDDIQTKFATVKSNDKGLFEIKGLKDGTYYLIETKAPEDHELLTKAISFTVSKTSYATDDNNAEVIKNVPTSKLPLTGGMGTALFTAIGFALIGMAAVLFFASRKSKKSN